MNIHFQTLSTRTLQEEPWGESAARILSAALAAVDPSRLIQEHVSRKNNELILAGNEVDLEEYARVYILGIGKAAYPMTVSMADILGDRFAEGCILTKKGNHKLPEIYRNRLSIFTGGHPFPNEEGQLATAEILSRLSSLNNDELVIVLISGGSSALFTYPAEGISLTDLIMTNQILLSCGADIQEINTIRKHLSRIKGGQLARILQPARTYTLILSDVIGDQIDIIGSGPTTPDPSTFADALAVINNYHLEGELPPRVITYLDQGLRGIHPETPKPNESVFTKVVNQILASNQNALQAGAEQAKAEGFSVDILPQFLTGEASMEGEKMAKQLVDMARNGQPLPRPACLIAGGETTVTLTSTKHPGRGGRNLEIALSALPFLDGLENAALITLATDGEDGLTDAAGAVVTGKSLQRCQQLDLDPGTYLKNHDSYTLFESLGDLLLTGPTGTNVNDLCFLLTF